MEVLVVPAPKLLPGCVLVRTAASLVSVGTERASSEFARKNLMQKARMRPDLVREVWNKVRRKGVGTARSSARLARGEWLLSGGRFTGRGGTSGSGARKGLAGSPGPRDGR